VRCDDERAQQESKRRRFAQYGASPFASLQNGKGICIVAIKMPILARIGWFAVRLAITGLAASPVSAQKIDLNATLKTSQEALARGDYFSAELEAKKLEQEIKARFGSNHPNYATGLNHLANVYRILGNYKEAERLYQQALAINENALGSFNSSVASVLNNLAIVYQAEGRYG
jgi:tetratricopeptide (TPR) repeat protein